MKVDSTKVSVVVMFIIMFAAIILQVMVFLDPQNNLITGGVTANNDFIAQGGLATIVVIAGFVLAIQGFRYNYKK